MAAKSLILDLLATLKAGAVMPIGALVEAGALFGLSENNIRVSVARLLANRLIARDERGSYRLGERSQPIGQRVRSWRDLDRRTGRWSGDWIAVFFGRSDRAASRRRERALGLIGFGRLRDALAIRPDNLVASPVELRSELASLGLPDDDLVGVLRDLDEDVVAKARALWDVAGMRSRYRELRLRIERGSGRLRSLSNEQAMVESFLLGGAALRELVRDPLLPEEICPNTERDALLAAMRDYDRLGRLAWAKMLRKWDVPYLRAPLDGRSESERPRLAV